MTSSSQVSNFDFLAEHESLFVELAFAAERAFISDPNATLIKLRQLGEALAQHIAALTGVNFDEQTSQADLLYRLSRELKFEPVVRELFHTLRIEGNKATHQFKTQQKEPLTVWSWPVSWLFGFIGRLVSRAPALSPAPLWLRLTPMNSCASCKAKSVRLREIYSRPISTLTPVSS